MVQEDSGWAIYCSNEECGCQFGLYSSRLDMIPAWNRRVGDVLPAELTEEQLDAFLLQTGVMDKLLARMKDVPPSPDWQAELDKLGDALQVQPDEMTEVTTRPITPSYNPIVMIPEDAWNRLQARLASLDVGLTVNEYQLSEDNPRVGGIVLRRMLQRDGSIKWAIYDGSNVVLSREYEDGDPWEYEPLPSSRDEAYLKRCRYDSIEEALQHWQVWLQRRPAHAE
jgi:hypothetical protein